MRKALCDANLWRHEDGDFHNGSIIAAWQVMARLGYPYRFCGQGPQGGYECQVYDAASGESIALGRGRSCAEAMCAAALRAVTRGDQVVPLNSTR